MSRGATEANVGRVAVYLLEGAVVVPVIACDTVAVTMLAQSIPLPDVTAQLHPADPNITAHAGSHWLGEDRHRSAASVFDPLAVQRDVG